MSSREWWRILVEKIFLEDRKLKKAKINGEQLLLISDKIFDEFKKDTYWKKFDNCDVLLGNLKKKGYKIGAISNFDERIFLIVKNLGIEKYFDFILIPSNSNGNYKPQKEIFLQALIKCNIDKPKNRILHVGDSLELDYYAAKKCEFNSILIAHDIKIKDFSYLNGNYATDLYDLEKKILSKF